ncbi:MAG: hypothetical protein PHH78_03890 [Methanothrix sp.]|jgi:hypothetical protein|nr:hypothetical protein [Methanothrix sp.]
MIDESEWIAEFELFGPILIKSIKDVDGIIFDIEKHSDLVSLKGFSITVSSAAPDDAFICAQEKANRIFDYLSFLRGYAIGGYLKKIIENKPIGERKTGALQFKTDIILFDAEDIDFGPIKDILENKNVKLSRQLAHYSMGLKSEYIPIKVQQFFQVAEDEYDSKHRFIEEYRWVRHIVSHPELNKSKIAMEKAKERGFDECYVDLSNPRHMNKLQESLIPIKTEAHNIINSHIPDFDKLFTAER